MDADADLPEDINYWITSTSKHDCYFKVGPESGPKVRIGAIKVLLFAQSEVLQKMLDESPLAETGDIPVPDSNPDTFMNFLKCVYGGTDIVIRKLSFDKCIDILYLCEKYLTLKVKKNISLLILKLYHPLTIDQVMVGLSNPVCLADPSDTLAHAFSKIIKRNTEEILGHELFLNLDSNAVEFIVKQEQISVEEANLWEAVFKWAQNKSGSEDSKDIRLCMENILKHIRFCAMPAYEFCKKVVPSKVLTPEEVFEICTSIGTKNALKLDGLCCEISDRKKATQEITFTYVLNNIKEFSGFVVTPEYKLGEFNWNLKIKQMEKNELAIYLYCSSAINISSWRCSAKFKVTLVNHSGGVNLIKSSSLKEFTNGRNNIGFTRFLNVDDLVNVRNGFILNNAIEIITCVELIKEKEEFFEF